MTTSKRYEINNLEDIYMKLEKDQLDDFFVDLRRYIEMNIDIRRKVKELGLSQSLLKGSRLVWTDDGKHDISVTVKTKINVRFED